MKSFTLDDALSEHLKGNLKKADQMYTAILEKYPEDFPTYFYMASLRAQQNRMIESAVYLERSLQLENQACAWNNLGTIYRRLNHTELARKCLLKGLEVAGDLEADINNNVGTIYVNEGDPAAGEPYLRRAIELDPKHIQAHWNLGLLLLERRIWAEGWDNSHWGLQSPDRMNRWATWPQWKGEKGKVLIYGEQGLGDEIMFSSMLEEAGRDNEIVLECHPRLEETFKRNFPDFEIHPTRKEYIIENEMSSFQYRCAMGDLGMLYRRRDEDFPKKPYLKLDPHKVEEVRKGYERFPRPWIGIGWRGGSRKTRKELRSLPLDEWLPILKNKGTFFSFQYQPDADMEVDEFCKKHPDINLIHFPAIARSDNYDVILTHLLCMDLVVHVNGTGVHACGAIGTPCYTLTPSRPAWRYSIKGKDMPFYGENVRQIRQKDDNWQRVIKIAANLIKAGKFPRRLYA